MRVRTLELEHSGVEHADHSDTRNSYRSQEWVLHDLLTAGMVAFTQSASCDTAPSAIRTQLTPRVVKPPPHSRVQLPQNGSATHWYADGHGTVLHATTMLALVDVTPHSDTSTIALFTVFRHTADFSCVPPPHVTSQSLLAMSYDTT